MSFPESFIDNNLSEGFRNWYKIYRETKNRKNIPYVFMKLWILAKISMKIGEPLRSICWNHCASYARIRLRYSQQKMYLFFPSFICNALVWCCSIRVFLVYLPYNVCSMSNRIQIVLSVVSNTLHIYKFIFNPLCKTFQNTGKKTFVPQVNVRGLCTSFGKPISR